MNATASKTLYTLASSVLLVSIIAGAPARAGDLEDQLAMTDGSGSQSIIFYGPQGRPAYVGAAMRKSVWLDEQLAVSDGNLQPARTVSEGPEGPRAERAPSSGEGLIERQRMISDGSAQ